MKVALIHDAVFPVAGYGGTERLVWWLAKGLKELGASPVIVGLPGTECPFAEVFPASRPFPSALPACDVYHYFNTPPLAPSHPYLVTIGGNAKAGEVFLPNTVFISRNHAERHGSDVFVYNGVDPSDCLFEPQKRKHVVFLAKASWKVKNVRGAISVARRAGLPLSIIGGSRPWLPKWRGTHWAGQLGGKEKLAILSSAKALLFPVRWHEPFGLAVVEAMLCGTPVLASPFGSLPELISKESGRICASTNEMVDACHSLSQYSPEAVKNWALRFSHLEMAKHYLARYEQVLAGKALHSQPLTVASDQGGLLEFA